MKAEPLAVIRPPGFRGVAFTTAAAGDLRAANRAGISVDLGISAAWATVHQVHEDRVLHAAAPGMQGEADALTTTTADLPIAVFTADCAAVVVECAGAVGAAHAGWRGARLGVVRRLLAHLRQAGHEPLRAAVGPTIGACCFEVGPEVATEFEAFAATTTWGTASVDLVGVVAAQLGDLATWTADTCTMCTEGMFSHREDGTAHRLAGVGWMP